MRSFLVALFSLAVSTACTPQDRHEAQAAPRNFHGDTSRTAGNSFESAQKALRRGSVNRASDVERILAQSNPRFWSELSPLRQEEAARLLFTALVKTPEEFENSTGLTFLERVLRFQRVNEALARGASESELADHLAPRLSEDLGYGDGDANDALGAPVVAAVREGGTGTDGTFATLAEFESVYQAAVKENQSGR